MASKSSTNKVCLDLTRVLVAWLVLAGNVACDEQGGGRLIFYDFGMMDEFKPMVRSGLVNLIFSTYENDPRAVCDALVEMGILKASADRIR